MPYKVLSEEIASQYFRPELDENVLQLYNLYLNRNMSITRRFLLVSLRVLCIKFKLIMYCTFGQ